MKTFLKENIVVWVWIVLAVFTELFSICFADCKPYLSEPLYILLCFFPLVFMLILIPNKIAKTIVICVVWFFQIAMCLGFIYLFEMNGTTFDFSMIHQRNDGFAMIEDLSLNVIQTAVLLTLYGMFLFFAIIYCVCLKRNRTAKCSKMNKPLKIVTAVLMCVITSFLVVVPVCDGIKNRNQSYTKILYNDGYSKYQSLGITANAIYELFNGTIVDNINTSNLGTLDEYLFGTKETEKDMLLKTSKFNGISAGNNLIMIMVESFDWYPLTWYDAETTKKIYPNITKFMGDSLVFTNYYSREKTDTSENNAMLGSNPTGKYMNYDFESNEYPYALPNMLEREYGDELVSIAYHQNTGSYYNRKKTYNSLGFDKFYAIEDMESYGLVNTWTDSEWDNGGFTRDSLTMDCMKETMFPLDKQFFTYWLTFSMHGYYEERENLSNFIYVDEFGDSYENGYYGYFDGNNVFPESDQIKANYLRTYAAAVKDFDVALGIMMDYLTENNLLDTTTIVVYSDHNTYYNNLAYYAKDVPLSTYQSSLYRIPCMIYDKELCSKYVMEYGFDCYENIIGNDNSYLGKCATISKFTTAIDLIPTILDLFGIKGWKNLYLGTSMFVEDVESIVYSRSYGVFVTDKIVCYSIKKPLYMAEDFDKEDFIARAEKHLSKQEYLDKIFYSNYFKNHEYKIPS